MILNVAVSLIFMTSPYCHMAARSHQLRIMRHVICEKTTFFFFLGKAILNDVFLHTSHSYTLLSATVS